MCDNKKNCVTNFKTTKKETVLWRDFVLTCLCACVSRELNERDKYKMFKLLNHCVFCDISSAMLHGDPVTEDACITIVTGCLQPPRFSKWEHTEARNAHLLKTCTPALQISHVYLIKILWGYNCTLSWHEWMSIKIDSRKNRKLLSLYRFTIKVFFFCVTRTAAWLPESSKKAHLQSTLSVSSHFQARNIGPHY